jgi:hypothetical protein
LPERKYARPGKKARKYTDKYLILQQFGAGLGTFGAGLFFCRIPAPHIGLLCILMAQDRTLFPDLRHLTLL